ncbi:universal stress protein [Streptomyces sp. NPDC049040]|uniref:universal stress protein n=1 Tax=Streptomyces sp. NPDC049040 TaxID=3365593 RepID=UPI00371DBEE8
MTRYAVVGVDGSKNGREAARWAAEEAATRGLGLRMVTVVPAEPARMPSGWESAGWRKPVPGPAEVFGDIAAAFPGPDLDLDLSGRQIAGDPADVLPGIARGAEVVVVGMRGAGGFDGLRLGSVALAVADRAPCPVVLVPPPAATGKRRHEVVVGVDARHPDEGALEVAFEEAAVRGARLRAVHAWGLPTICRGVVFGVLEEDRAEWEDQEVQLLDDALRNWRRKRPEVAVLPDVRLFGAADALVRASADAELLIVGRGARNAGHLGGVVHAVAHHTRCPLLLARRH